MKLPKWPSASEYKSINFGIDNAKKILEKLGNPHHNLPPVIHVAGTNGKGSTIAFLRSIFEAAGYKVHQYTSPHLIEFNERIVVAGKKISDANLNKILNEVKKAADAENLKPSFFEATTIAAFVAFSRVKADILLLETGMGGRLDTTNVIGKFGAPAPIATIITPISYDHMQFLGKTIEAIASEKAGILKAGVKCIISNERDDATHAIKIAAKHIKSPLSVVNKDWFAEVLEEGFKYKSKEKELVIKKIGLLGEHQFLNAAAAINAIENIEGFKISKKAILEGIAKAKWPGRMQKISSGKIGKLAGKNIELYLDGAHNVGGSEVLAEMIYCWKEKDDKKTYLIFGMAEDKNERDFINNLRGLIAKIYTVKIKSDRAKDPMELARSFKKMGFNAIRSKDIKSALKQIKESKEKCRVVICGSLFLCAEALEMN
jgi:dihydrofolate synthase/folylpolyglutamate synthase